ncbi:MAG: FAD-dependent oxidoreductase [Pseudomonadota bacterium]
MARNRTDAVIMGAGAAGLACAYFLNRAGMSVQILERHKVGQGASYGNLGLITPTHSHPLPGPGQPLMAFRSMFDENAPFHLRPRFDTAMARWMWQFLRNCNRKTQDEVAQARQALMKSSRTLTEKLVKGEKLDCQFNDAGLMGLAISQRGLDELAGLGEALAAMDIETATVDGDQLREAEPSLRKRVMGGLWFPQDASLRPDRFASELQWACHKRGVQLQEDCEIKALTSEGGRIVSAYTDRGNFEGKHFIVSAGVWSPQLLKGLKLDLPIQAGMGYSMTTRKPDPCPSFPLILHEANMAVTPFDDGYRLGGTMEFAGADAAPNPKRFMALIAGARRYLTEPLGAGEPTKWHGYRPMTPDDLPIIGPTESHPNLFLATGHNMYGMTLAAGTGRLLAELVTGRKPHLDPTPYLPSRFRGMRAH